MSTIKWDVPLGQRIRFFDGRLSYELTKYRPISETEGLDFQASWFNEAGARKDEFDRYTTFPIGTKSHRDWWTEEMRRCKDGYEVNGYRITGDHYFFLNYYTLANIEGVTKAGQGRDKTRPRFWAKHYEYFHYIEVCETLKRDVIAFKSRGVGFSEIAVALGVRPYITNPEYYAVYIAFSDGLLEPTLSKVWDQLEWLNLETETAFLRLRQKKDTNMHKRASMINSDGIEIGHKAELQGIIVDNPRKLRGRRIDRLIFEESGSNPILTETYIKGNALVELGGRKMGTRVVFGTGGDEGAPLAGLEKMFLKPESFKGLPYRHCYTQNGEDVMTGFFLPAYSCVMSIPDEETNTDISAMDHRGVTNEQMARDYYNAERMRLVDSPKELMDYCAEYCFYPEEALSKQGQNDFNQVLIAQQMTEIKIHKRVPEPDRGRLFWDYAEGSEDHITGVHWSKDPLGDIYISEHPILGEGNKPMKNLYCSGTDSIDHGVDDSVVGERGSKFCITIKKRRFGNSGNKYVAYYLERPSDVRLAYANAARLLWYYNCKTNLEDTKINFRTWLREKKLDYKMLMERPSFALGDKRPSATLWGTPGSEKMIRHGLALIVDFVEDGCHTIEFLAMLEQLQKFSYDAKGSFDIVMSMVYCEIADEDMYDLRIRKVDDIASQWQDFGYYIDERGYRQFGIIPGQKPINNQLFPNHPYEIVE